MTKQNVVDRYSYKSFHDYRGKIFDLTINVPMTRERIGRIAQTIYHKEEERSDKRWAWRINGVWSPARSLEFRLRQLDNPDDKERALIEASMVTPKMIEKFMDNKVLSKDEQDIIIAATNTSDIPRTFRTRSGFDENLRKRFYAMDPGQAGVYFLYDSDKNLLYIGTSKELPFRASRQCADKIKDGVRYISFMFTDSENEARAVETNLIRENKPVLNKQEVHGKHDPKFKYPRKSKLYKCFSDT